MITKKEKVGISFYYIWRKLKDIFIPKTERGPYYIMDTSLPLSEVIDRLISIYFSFNYWEYNEKQEVLGMRRLYVEDGRRRQVHLRVYEEDREGLREVRGHDEIAYEDEEDMIDHIKGVTLRRVSPKIIEEIQRILA